MDLPSGNWSNIAIENDHWSSEFSQLQNGDFNHSIVNIYRRVLWIKGIPNS